MSLRNVRHLAASALVLSIALLPVAALAAPRDPGAEVSVWLDHLWGRLVSLWEKEGCQVLPDGRPYCPGRVNPDRPSTGVDHSPVEKASPEGAAAEPRQPGAAGVGRVAVNNRA